MDAVGPEYVKENDGLRGMWEAALLSTPPNAGARLIGFYVALVWDEASDPYVLSYARVNVDPPQNHLYRGLLELVADEVQGTLALMDGDE